MHCSYITSAMLVYALELLQIEQYFSQFRWGCCVVDWFVVATFQERWCTQFLPVHEPADNRGVVAALRTWHADAQGFGSLKSRV